MKKRRGIVGVLTAAVLAVCVGLVVAIPAGAADGIDIDSTFPDEAFREYVSGEIDTNGDGKLSSSEIAAVSTIWIVDSDVESLSGIEVFTELTELVADENFITKADLSRNTKLETVSLSENLLESVDVGKCTMLDELFCDENRLTYLDVSRCTKLTTLVCSDNFMQELDLRSNKKLYELKAEDNLLETLDISECAELGALICSGNFIKSLDVSTAPLLYCLKCEGNLLTSLDVTHNSKLHTLDVSDNKLASLDISQCTELNTLDFENNRLTTVDLSTCPDLEYLNCGYNPIEDFAAMLAPLSKLRSLSCQGLGLTQLDLSAQTKLTFVRCNDNRIASLDMTSHKWLSTLFCMGNPGIKVSLCLTFTSGPSGEFGLYTSTGSELVLYPDEQPQEGTEYTWMQRGAITKPVVSGSHPRVVTVLVDRQTALYEYYCNMTNGSVTQKTGFTLNLRGVPEFEYSKPRNVRDNDYYFSKYAVKVYYGAKVELEAHPAVNENASIQWYYSTAARHYCDENAVPGANGKKAKFSFTAGDFGNDSWVYYRATNEDGSFDQCHPIILYVLPRIVSQPKEMAVSAGSTAKFSVVAEAGAELTYQWQVLAPGATCWKNSTAANATTPTFSLKAQTGHNGYKVRCVIKDPYDDILATKPVTLKVASAGGPTIKTQPKDTQVSVGETAKMTVVATGTGTLTYQWQTSAPSQTTWKNSTNATAKKASFSITAQAGHDGYQFRCVITDSTGKKTITMPVTLKVATVPGPKITTQPKDTTVSAGTAASFKVVATGTGTLTYQWQTLAPGATAWKNSTNSTAKKATFKITTQAAHNGYKVRCIVTDSTGNTTTSVAAIRVQ